MRIDVEKLRFIDNPVIAHSVGDYINNCELYKLFHIDLYAIADTLNIERKLMLDYAIRGIPAGFFSLQWNYHCTSCGGIVKETSHIHDASASCFCGACNITFRNTVDKNVEVFFSIHPAIVPLPQQYEQDFKKQMTGCVNGECHAFKWQSPTTIYASHLIQNQTFRELLGTDVLLADQSLAIEKAVIIFTDIKSSTQLYSQLGDARAFALVSDHFRLLFDVIQKNNGVPVKTIGDAVMGVFVNDTDALRASIESQQALIDFYGKKPAEEQIEVKIGIHGGTAIIVTLNGRLDYFGTTVNLAARIQSSAHPNEIVFSQELFESPQNKQLLLQYTKKLRRSRHSFKGIAGETIVYHMDMKQL